MKMEKVRKEHGFSHPALQSVNLILLLFGRELMQILHTHGYMKISNSTDVMEAQFS
jgi:hypothetical protein